MMNRAGIALALVAGIVVGAGGYALFGGAGKANGIGGELDTILKKIELAEKIGIPLDWSELVDGRFKENLIKELVSELRELNKKVTREKDNRLPPGSDLLRPIPDPDGWERRLLDNGMVEFTKDGEVWWWDPFNPGWRLPPGVTHPDPNPITPTGERAAGSGTF